MFQIIYTFPEEQGIINKERASRSYRGTAVWAVGIPRNGP